MRRLAATAIAALSLALPTSAQQMDEAVLKALILDTIRENPEVVMEALQTLQAEQEAEQAAAQAAALQAQLGALQNDPNAPVMGNPEGEITVVEFFDYNCSYCRRVFPSVRSVMENDPTVRVVMREWPILSEESVFAARAALASRNQGKYAEFHNAMMGHAGRATEALVMQVAEEVGLDTDQLRIDMEGPEIDAHIATSRQLAQSLGINGTPAFVIGDQLVPGFVELDQMQTIIDAQRG